MLKMQDYNGVFTFHAVHSSFIEVSNLDAFMIMCALCLDVQLLAQRRFCFVNIYRKN